MTEQANKSTAPVPKSGPHTGSKKLKSLSEISAANATLEDVKRAASLDGRDCSFLLRVSDPNQNPPAKSPVAKAANDAKNTPGICSATWSDNTSEQGKAQGGSNSGSGSGSKQDEKGKKASPPNDRMSAGDALEKAGKAADPRKK